MRLFIAGATGAVGRPLLKQLLQQGHELVCLARTPDRSLALAAMGVAPVVVDPLDAGALGEAVERSGAEVVIHQLTALASATSLRNFDRDFALTNRFRTEVLDTMLAAAQRGGARRFIAQSFCGWPYARTGPAVKSEDDALDPDPPNGYGATLAAIRHLEQAILAARGIEALALRYGVLYGPGTSIAADGAMAALLRKRAMPLVGGGTGTWSFTHVEDAAAATVAALDHGAPGLYNVVDDEPAPVSDWLPALAEALDAPRPWPLPAWLARLAIGPGGVAMMTINRGGANAKARRELRWRPLHPSWRTGFRALRPARSQSGAAPAM